MIGPNNWAMVKCATPDCTAKEWLMHWPCEGTEEEIRNGQHFCAACHDKKFEEACNADPQRTYPVKRLKNVEVKVGDRTLTKTTIVEEEMTIKNAAFQATLGDVF